MIKENISWRPRSISCWWDATMTSADWPLAARQHNYKHAAAIATLLTLKSLSAFLHNWIVMYCLSHSHNSLELVSLASCRCVGAPALNSKRFNRKRVHLCSQKYVEVFGMRPDSLGKGYGKSPPLSKLNKVTLFDQLEPLFVVFDWI